jgi:integrase
MAEVFRPTYTVTDPKTGKRKKKKSRTWHIRYYTPDGQRHRVKGYRDKKATETKAAELERRGIRLDAGIVDPTEEHAKKPLADHAEDFRRYLAAKGNTEDYVKLASFRLTAILDRCSFVKIADVQPSSVLECLASLRQEGKSIKTANEYLAAVKGFTRWLWRDKRAALDVLAGMSKLANGETDIRHARRDLSPEELDWLLSTTRASKRSFRGLTGIDRHCLYLTACATGFRVSELASMAPESFALDSDMPTATVEAACSKNRKQADQPLPADMADVLKNYLWSKPAGLPVWPGKSWPVHASMMIQRDLAKAREKWLSAAHDAPDRDRREASDFLAYRDAEGRYADFHALRHSFITMVGKLPGISPKEHQDLARHSTYALTGRYTHSRSYDLAAAVQSLPIPTAGPGQESVALAATGTDGKNLSPNLGPRQAVLCDFLTQSETASGMAEGGKNHGKSVVSAVFPGFAAERRKERDTGVEPV